MKDFPTVGAHHIQLPERISDRIVAEAVMLRLAPQLARNGAHEIVEEACRTVDEESGTPADVLAGMRDVTSA